MALINVDVTSEEQIELIKREYKSLQINTVTCLSSGFIFLLSAPFMFAPKNNYFFAFSRYISLIGSLSMGAMSIVFIKRLEEIEPHITVIKKAETRTFITKSATSEWTLSKLFEREASTILRPVQPVTQDEPTEAPDNHPAPPSDNLRHDHSAKAAENSAQAATESGEDEAAPEDEVTDPREARLKLLAQLKKNKKGKAEMIRRLFDIPENHPQYDYYLQMVEEMLAELKRRDAEI